MSDPIAGTWIDRGSGSQPWPHIGTMGAGNLRKVLRPGPPCKDSGFGEYQLSVPQLWWVITGIILLIALGVIMALW